MSLRPEHLQRLAALNLPGEAIREVLAIIADTHSPSAGAKRQARYREKKKTGDTDKSITSDATCDAQDTKHVPSGTGPDEPPLYWKSLDSTLEASASKGADAPSGDPVLGQPSEEKPTTPDAKLYQRAREIAGPKSAQYVTLLKRQNGGDVGDTRQMVEQAAMADNPLQYLIGIVARGKRKAEYGEARPPPREAPFTARFQTLSDIHHESDSSDETDHEASGAHASGGGRRLVGWSGRAG